MSAHSHIDTVRDFLAQRRIALVGLSSNPQDFSHSVYKDLVAHGYEVVPVHPTATELEGKPVFHSLREIPEPVDGAILMTPPQASAEVVRDAIAAGVRRVWLHRGGGQGAVSEEALRLCEEAHLDVVAGECPLMFLEDGSWIHRLHGWGRKVTGAYPN